MLARTQIHTFTEENSQTISLGLSIISGHALTCQSPATLALANTNNYTKKGSCSQHRPISKQLHVCCLGIVFQPMKWNNLRFDPTKLGIQSGCL